MNMKNPFAKMRVIFKNRKAMHLCYFLLVTVFFFANKTSDIYSGSAELTHFFFNFSKIHN